MNDSGTVLVVEDDEAIRRQLSEVLRDRGHDVVEAQDGLAALAAAQESAPALILAGVGLAGLDGFGVLSALKGDAALRDVPVLMVTAWADADLIRRVLDRGAAGYVRKPFALDELHAALDAALEVTEPETLETVIEAGRDLTAMVVAVDDLDIVVDLRGPEVASALVAAVTRRLSHALRRAGIEAREGTGELVVAAPDIDAKGAAIVAERFRASIRERPLDLPGTAVRATVSVGYATWEGETAAELVERAGTALAIARDAGPDAAHAAEPIAAALQAAA